MAGEIQLNSTTMATESSGTITLSNVNSATNRINLGLGSMATQASDNVTITGGNISNATLASSVTFPAGKLIDYDLQAVSSTVTASTANDTPGIAGSTAVSITLPAGSSALVSASGGLLYGAGGTTRRESTALISYTTDGTTPSSSSNIIYGGIFTIVSPPGTAYAPGIVEGKVDNATGSDVTLKWNWGVKGVSDPLLGQWQSISGRSTILLKTLIFKNQ